MNCNPSSLYYYYNSNCSFSQIFDMTTTTMMNTTIEEEEEEEEDYHQLLLPDEITTEILSRLPAESVMQCKLVCKTWQTLIVDPTFINMYTHRHYTLNTTTTAETEWVSFPMNVVSHLQFVKYYNNDDSGCHDHDENPIKQSKPIIYHPSSLKILQIKKTSSCNGLIFMTTPANKMFVCNPFTREYVDLPPIRFNNLRLPMRMATGFGYHSSTNEYKVIIIYYCSYSNRHGSYSKGQVTIYTLGNGGWRDKGEISHRVSVGATGVLFNGALLWLTEQMDEIVSFDLADEEFRIVPSPPSQSPPPRYHPYLGLLGGCLYVSRIFDPAQRSTDIWVMDSMEYSWSKKFSISWKSGLSNHRPLALLESGRILLHKCGMPFVSYDPETESSIVVDESEFLSVYTYTKTIVSLKELGEADATILDPDDSDFLIKKRKRNSDNPNCFS